MAIDKHTHTIDAEQAWTRTTDHVRVQTGDKTFGDKSGKHYFKVIMENGNEFFFRSPAMILDLGTAIDALNEKIAIDRINNARAKRNTDNGNSVYSLRDIADFKELSIEELQENKSMYEQEKWILLPDISSDDLLYVSAGDETEIKNIKEEDIQEAFSAYVRSHEEYGCDLQNKLLKERVTDIEDSVLAYLKNKSRKYINEV